MAEDLKDTSVFNVISFSVVTIAYVITVIVKSIAWWDLIISVNIILSTPFIFSGIVCLKRFERIKHNKELVRNLTYLNRFGLFVLILNICLLAIVLGFD